MMIMIMENVCFLVGIILVLSFICTLLFGYNDCKSIVPLIRICTLIVLLHNYLWNTLHLDMYNSSVIININSGMPNDPKQLSYGTVYQWLWKKSCNTSCSKRK